MDLAFAGQGNTSVVNCPRAMVGRVIGKGGACGLVHPVVSIVSQRWTEAPLTFCASQSQKFAAVCSLCAVECRGPATDECVSPAGETIKALQQYTGASIQIDQSFEPTAVTISGQQSAVSLAQAMVQVSCTSLLSSYNAVFRHLVGRPAVLDDALRPCTGLQ